MLGQNVSSVERFSSFYECSPTIESFQAYDLLDQYFDVGCISVLIYAICLQEDCAKRVFGTCICKNRLSLNIEKFS